MSEGDYNTEYWIQQESAYLKFLEENPVDVKNHIAIAALYEVIRRFDDCFLHCDKVLELSESDFEIAEAHVLMGRVHKEKKEYNSAIAYFLHALDFCPEHPVAIEDVGTCYTYIKDFQSAEYWFTKLEQIEECEEYAWMKLADLFYEIKDFDRSISYYEKCMEIYEDNFEALCGKGRCLAGKKLFTESIALFSKASELYPNDALSHYYLGVSYQTIEDQYRAMHHYMKALELDPDFAEVYNNVGKLYADFDGDIKTAIRYLETALEHVENGQLMQMLYINLARLNQRIADYERSDYYQSKIIDE